MSITINIDIVVIVLVFIVVDYLYPTWVFESDFHRRSLVGEAPTQMEFGEDAVDPILRPDLIPAWPIARGDDDPQRLILGTHLGTTLDHSDTCVIIYSDLSLYWAAPFSERQRPTDCTIDSSRKTSSKIFESNRS